MAGGAVAGIVIGVIACLALAALLVVLLRNRCLCMLSFNNPPSKHMLEWVAMCSHLTLLRNRCISDTCCPSTIFHQRKFCLFILTSNNFELCAWFRNWEVRRLLPASMQTTTSSGSAFQNMSYSSGNNFHRHLSSLLCSCTSSCPVTKILGSSWKPSKQWIYSPQVLEEPHR